MLQFELELLLEEHRHRSYVTCDPSCFCWDVENFVGEQTGGTMDKAELESLLMPLINHLQEARRLLQDISTRIAHTEGCAYKRYFDHECDCGALDLAIRVHGWLNLDNKTRDAEQRNEAGRGTGSAKPESASE